MLCQERDERKIEDEYNGDAQKIESKKRQIRLHKYIGILEVHP